MTTTNKYFKLSGDGALRKRLAAVYGNRGNIKEASISLTQETIKLKSTGNVSGTLAEEVISREATFKIVLQSQSIDNAALAFQSTVSQIAATTGTTFALPSMLAGDIFKLTHAKVSNVVLGALVAGVDYKLTAYAGIVEALRVIPATPGCSYDSAAYSALGMFVGADDEYQFLFWSDASKRVLELLRMKLSPGQYDLISNDFGEITLEGSLLVDPDVDTSTLPADLKALGGFMRLADAS